MNTYIGKLENYVRCPSASWRSMGPSEIGWYLEDLAPLMHMREALRRAKLSRQWIQPMILL